MGMLFDTTALAAGVIINILISAAVIWIVVNYMITEENYGKEKFSRCILCSVMLALVAIAGFATFAAVALMLRFTLLAAVLGLFVIFKGSTVIIESVFERTSGGFAIFCLYYLTLFAVTSAFSHLGG